MTVHGKASVVFNIISIERLQADAALKACPVPDFPVCFNVLYINSISTACALHITPIEVAMSADNRAFLFLEFLLLLDSTPTLVTEKVINVPKL